uniref:BICD family-like cargo adapter 2 n=1 Tax=Tetraodon nigroviridis TaxID=99883 RepID=H3CX84_TETNG
DPDLILAAELGQALLEKNEELAASLVQSQRQVEALQQEKHVLQRKMDMNELAFGQREAELVTDLAAAKAELERHHSQGRDRRKDECGQLTQLSSHNQRLVEQLAEAVTLEHSLRTELRSLREEMEESSFSRNINFKQLESIQAENRVLLERLAHMEVQLRASEEDSDRLRREREQLRERLSELQSTLREKEAEMEQEQGLVFELRSVNRSLQQKALNMGEDAILDGLQAQPLSLLSEIQQSQACNQAKDALLAHSSALQAKDEQIEMLKEECFDLALKRGMTCCEEKTVNRTLRCFKTCSELAFHTLQLQSQREELEVLREEIKPFRNSPGTPSYSLFMLSPAWVCSSLESELASVRQEKDSLTQQLLNTIKHKVALSQELDAWQEDMRLVINQQVRSKSLKVKGEA